MLHRHAANVPIRAMSAHGQILHTQGGTAVASLVKLVQDKTGNTILPGFSRVKAFNGRLFDATSLARLAQSAERKALNLVVVGSSPTVGDFDVPRAYCKTLVAVAPLRSRASASEVAPLPRAAAV